MNYKKLFLRILIAGITASAGIGIMIFLFGDFGSTEISLLLTTLAIGGFSLTGLCCSTLYEQDKFRIFSIVGMILSTIALVVSILIIWEFSLLDEIWQLMLIAIILAVGTAHVSLLLLIEPKNKEIRRTLEFTVLVIISVALMLINMVINFNDSELYFRLLGVLAILDVLGTIATPVLNRMATEKENR